MSEGTRVVSVARDYSRTPGPRFKSQGPYSGEAFRSVIADLLKANDRVEVDLDGTAGYGSSFLDEAFGGLVRHASSLGLDPETIPIRLTFRSPIDPSYAEEAKAAIEEALLALGKKVSLH